MANNLLDKSSIILTPTAYNNGEALCIKPSDGSGDFQFSRNSAATRVNAQGLVENVQILSSNLVQNGDFSEEGSEEVSNGSFTNGSTDWSLGTGWSIGEDKAVFDGGADANIIQSISITTGNTFKITLDVSEMGNGELSVRLGGGAATEIGRITENGSYVFYGVSISPNITFRALSSFNGSITNISVKEVGQNWSVSNSDANNYVEFGDGTARLKFLNTSPITSLESTAQYISGKKYKLTVDVKEVVSGGIKIDAAGVQQTYNSVGIQEAIIEPTGNSSISFYRATADVDITLNSVSLIEITDDTNLPRINYEGFSYQDVLGSELVTNGDFATDLSGWNLTGTNATNTITWEANGARLVCVDTNIGLLQNYVLTIGKKYKFTCNVSVTTGAIALDGVTSGTTTNLVDGNNEIYFTAAASTFKIKRVIAVSNCLIDNVSVKEYLGQEVVPDSGCGSWLWEPQTTQLVTYSELFSNAYWGNANVGTTPILETGFLAPDGTNNAFKISNANQNSFLYAITGGFNATSTRSIYARTVSGTGTAQLCSHNSNTNNTFTITEQWQRFELNATASGIGAEYFYAVDFRGSGTLSEIILWGANATNDQDYATSYIPSNGSQVTRNQDLCTNGGSLASINSTEGVLYAEIAALDEDFRNRYITISDGTINNRVVLRFNLTNEVSGFVRSGGITQVLFTHSINILDTNKVAIKYKENDFALWVNGVEVGTDLSGNTPIGLDRLGFRNASNDNPFFGKTKALAVFPYLSDSELQSLTTI